MLSSSVETILNNNNIENNNNNNNVLNRYVDPFFYQ